jgi:hypothetical protein
MKTFSEACESTFMRTVPVGLADHKSTMEAIDTRIGPFISMVDEIQNAPETEAFAHVLLEMADREDLNVGEVIKIAFSHGVMVGVEMEKPDA